MNELLQLGSCVVRAEDVEDLLSMLELIVGAAVMCEDKATFIRNIFLLNHASQTVLKGLVEQVLSRAEDIAAFPSDGVAGGGYEPNLLPDFPSTTSSLKLHEDFPRSRAGLEEPYKAKDAEAIGGPSEEERLRLVEMVSHLQMERQRLLENREHLSSANEALRSQLRRLEESSSHLAQERQEKDQSSSFLEQKVSRLEMELDELHRDQDLRVVELERLRADLAQTSHRYEHVREALLQLEMRSRQQVDELELAKDRAERLDKAEQALEKYQRRLEEMQDLKRQNKLLSDKLDLTLDQVSELEATNKGLVGVNRLVEQYRHKAVQLEREKIELLSAAKARDAQLTGLKEDLEAAVTGRYRVEDELSSLRRQLESQATVEENDERSEGLGGSEDGAKGVKKETLASLRENIRRLQRKERALRLTGGTAEPLMGEEDQRKEEEEDSELVGLLKKEIEDLKGLKTEREEQLLAETQQVVDLQQALTRSQRSIEESQRVAAFREKDLQGRLGEMTTTISILEQRLREKEALADRLEQEKGKLELYTKRSLATFKEKYLAVLQTMKEEKKELEGRIQLMTERAEANQETWHREERMLSAAIYEVGVRIMDRRIQSMHPQEGSAAEGAAGLRPGQRL